MSRSIITFRLRDARRDLGFDALERRQVMSTIVGFSQPGGVPAESSTAGGVADSSGMGVILSVSPSNGQVFNADAPPRDIVIHLDESFSPGLWSDDILLMRVGSDGATTPVGLLSSVIDFEAHTATIPLAGMVDGTQANALDPGRYRIELAAGDFSHLISQGQWDSTRNQTLAEFQVVGRSTTLADAVDLGTVGSKIQVVPGDLDVQGGASFTLYRFTLDSSQPVWRLGLQLDAERIGSRFQGALTLFDQHGRVLQARDSGTGLGDQVTDPYLFAALTPGVYYVGISGRGNLGGQPGGYDPTTGEPGASTVDPTWGGTFQLQYVADPLTSPTRVVDFSLQWGDSSRSPIGFTVTFSGAIDPESLQGDPLHVQDAQGNTWPLAFDAVGSRLDQVKYYFGQLLPPGEYSLMVPHEGGLTDFVGWAPVADGLPAGTLASWTVVANDAPPLAGDEAVPVTFEKSGDRSLVANGETTIDEGREVTLRLVVPPLAGSLMNVRILNGSLRVRRVDAGGAVDIAGAPITPTEGLPFTNAYDLKLSQGIYLLTLSAEDVESAAIDWRITLTLQDAQISNAVGSAGALSLRGAGAGVPDAPGGPMGSPAPLAILSSSQAGAFTAGALPTSFASTASATLVGRPSARNDSISVVGPTAPGGLVAMASADRGLLPGLISASEVGDDGHARDPEGPIVRTQGEETPAESSAEGDGVRLAENEEVGVRADERALLEADRLAEAARSVSPWLFRGVKDALEAVAEGDPVRAIEIAQNQAVGGDRAGEVDGSGQIDRAALGVPVSVVVAAAAAFRFRQIARKWWRRSPAGARAPGASPHPFWRGPRFMASSRRRARTPLREAQRV